MSAGSNRCSHVLVSQTGLAGERVQKCAERLLSGRNTLGIIESWSVSCSVFSLLELESGATSLGAFCNVVRRPFSVSQKGYEISLSQRL